MGLWCWFEFVGLKFGSHGTSEQFNVTDNAFAFAFDIHDDARDAGKAARDDTHGLTHFDTGPWFEHSFALTQRADAFDFAGFYWNGAGAISYDAHDTAGLDYLQPGSEVTQVGMNEHVAGKKGQRVDDAPVFATRKRSICWQKSFDLMCGELFGHRFFKVRPGIYGPPVGAFDDVKRHGAPTSYSMGMSMMKRLG